MNANFYYSITVSIHTLFDNTENNTLRKQYGNNVVK